jgi:hypothetical protein
MLLSPLKVALLNALRQCAVIVSCFAKIANSFTCSFVDLYRPTGELPASTSNTTVVQAGHVLVSASAVVSRGYRRSSNVKLIPPLSRMQSAWAVCKCDLTSSFYVVGAGSEPTLDKKDEGRATCPSVDPAFSLPPDYAAALARASLGYVDDKDGPTTGAQRSWHGATTTRHRAFQGLRVAAVSQVCFCRWALRRRLLVLPAHRQCQ